MTDRIRTELLERQAAPVPVPGVADTRYEFSVCNETGMEVADGSASTYAQALSEGRHYLAQYQQDEPHTLELRRVEVLHPDALPAPVPAPVAKPVAWMYKGEPDYDGKKWRENWKVTTSESTAMWEAAPEHPVPLYALPLPAQGGEVEP